MTIAENKENADQKNELNNEEINRKLDYIIETLHIINPDLLQQQSKNLYENVENISSLEKSSLKKK